MFENPRTTVALMFMVAAVLTLAGLWAIRVEPVNVKPAPYTPAPLPDPAPSTLYRT
jgi:hypothetical protein